MSDRSGVLTGAWPLLRLSLRRDRLSLPAWLLGLGGLVGASAAAVPGIYDTPEKIAGYARSVGSSPVSYLMSGRQAGLDTLGGVVANEISQVAQLGIALMVVFLVVRHTRAEEESGRAELLRSTVLGRHAAAVVAIVLAGTAAVLLGAATTLAMLAVEVDVVGAVTYGAGLALLGTVYAAVALVAAQLASSARGALGLAGAAVGVGYLVRGLGALEDSALVWASPFGWAQELDAFGRERWWPALLLVGATVALLALAGRLTAHRDHGGGLLAARPGPARAPRRLGSPLGLLLRSQRGLLLGWGTGLATLGLLYGAVLPTVPDLVASNPEMAEVFGGSADAEQALVLALLRYVHVFLALLVAAAAVASALRFRAEEESGRLELLLATPVRRPRVLVASAVVAALAVTASSALAGVGLGVGELVATPGAGAVDLGSRVLDQLAYAPATAVLAGLAVAVVGLQPRWSVLAWAALALVGTQVLLGETLRLPDSVSAASPFEHLPGLPVEPFTVAPGAVELGVAAALVVLGLVGLRRRDVGG